ncbi:hypothetical protein GCM10017709_16240 [Glutamicibacter nicotianae]|uniref:Uncharacterized protein n=1 Tax=Glutamicibacter nicotianae TaxID=37929 RepID=A0ABQ0RIR7_GLUNI|nr:hypothetical protein ANI01nite_09090 [Glutamicibacter nicotianae]
MPRGTHRGDLVNDLHHFKGSYLGTLGSLHCLSFFPQASKNHSILAAAFCAICFKAIGSSVALRPPEAGEQAHCPGSPSVCLPSTVGAFAPSILEVSAYCRRHLAQENEP